MNIEILYSIHRRWQDGQKPSEIASQEGLHRATVYQYIKTFQGVGFAP
jgi:DNA-binding IclR family transcriptional regulator